MSDPHPGPSAANRPPASAFDPGALAAYDDYAHGRIDRREFARRAAAFAGVGVAAGAGAEGLIAALAPDYAWAQQVAPDDPRVVAGYVTYSSPWGGGEIRGLLARPAGGDEEKFPAMLVVHENRGLNPYIEDVARRLAVAGYLALAPDALTPLGGYPGNDDDGRAMQQKRDGEAMTRDFVAAAQWLDTHPRSTGKVGVVGFCYGGGIANALAVRIPEVIDAAVPFYGRQPDAADVPKIEAALLIHNAGLDDRVLAGAPAYEAALKAAGVDYTAHVYPGVNHGFHNDSTPRYDGAAATLAWDRTLAFLKKELTEPEAAAWRPPAKPDPDRILSEARDDADAGRLAVALAKHVWFHDRALEYQPGQYGVRLSFALGGWKDLADEYPPALAALKAARDRAEADAGDDPVIVPFQANPFHDAVALNAALGEEARTVALFTKLDAGNPPLAARFADLARPALIRAERYDLAGKYVDPEGFDQAVDSYERTLALADGQGDAAAAATRDFAVRHFENQAATTVALLARTGRAAAAGSIAEKAAGVRDDPAFRRSLDEALTGEVPAPWPN